MATNKNEDMPISKGLRYKNKESGEEVVPFLVEMSGLVVYAPVGSSREVRTNAAEFNDMFDLNDEQFKEAETSTKKAEARAKAEPADSFESAGDKRVATGNGTTVDGEPTKAPVSTDRTNDAQRKNPALRGSNEEAPR